MRNVPFRDPRALCLPFPAVICFLYRATSDNFTYNGAVWIHRAKRQSESTRYPQKLTRSRISRRWECSDLPCIYFLSWHQLPLLMDEHFHRVLHIRRRNIVGRIVPTVSADDVRDKSLESLIKSLLLLHYKSRWSSFPYFSLFTPLSATATRCHTEKCQCCKQPAERRISLYEVDFIIHEAVRRLSRRDNYT